MDDSFMKKFPNLNEKMLEDFVNLWNSMSEEQRFVSWLERIMQNKTLVDIAGQQNKKLSDIENISVSQIKELTSIIETLQKKIAEYELQMMNLGSDKKLLN